LYAPYAASKVRLEDIWFGYKSLVRQARGQKGIYLITALVVAKFGIVVVRKKAKKRHAGSNIQYQQA
jgi:hypothetical protein